MSDDIVDFYRDDICGSDSYHRYYPKDWEYPDEHKQGLSDRINNWLKSEGVNLNVDYILIRIDW